MLLSLWAEQAAACPDSPSPAAGEGNGGAKPSAASGGCSEAEHPQRSKKSSKRAARSSFRVPQGGGGKYAVATLWLTVPLAQGSLWLGVASTTLSSKSRPGGRQEGRYCRSARYCSSRASSWAAVSARMALGSAARSSAGVRLPQVISTVGRPRFLPREISTWESPT